MGTRGPDQRGMRTGRLVSVLLLFMGIIASMNEIQGRGMPLEMGAFKRRLMKYQGRQTISEGGFYNQGFHSQDTRSRLAALKVLGMVPDKRTSWNKKPCKSSNYGCSSTFKS